jgi:secretion/DNA translocation related CpaE-like protein
VVGVIGGSGGVGASTFAAVLAAVAVPSVLVDLDPVGGGSDVLLGIESVRGARWSQLRLDGGWLDPALLADGLPRWRGVAVLAVDALVPSPAGVVQVIDAAAELGTVVVDLPRAESEVRAAAGVRCVLIVLVVAAHVRAVAAARAVWRSLPNDRCGVVVRRGELPAREVAELIGAPLLGVLPAMERGQLAERLPRAEVRVAAGLVDGLGVVGGLVA